VLDLKVAAEYSGFKFTRENRELLALNSITLTLYMNKYVVFNLTHKTSI
jgi:hypothetical protein